MRIAYLVLTHRNPQLLKRTIQALSSDNCAFFVHVDKKSDIADFSDVKGKNVFFSQKRIPVHWGEFSGVRAMMLLMRQAFEAPESYDYFVHLSGSDYPLRSRSYIHSYFEANRGSEFITLTKVPAPGKPLSRIANVRYESDKPVRRLMSKALAKLGLAGRNYKRHLGGLEPHSGRALWALSQSACRYLLEFIARNPAVEKFFENTFAPDEAFFHTILANSEFGPRARGNLVYEDWSAHGAHPEMIGTSHLARFESSLQVFENENADDASECLFARKFSDESHGLLDSLDEMIVRKDPLRPSHCERPK
jgi:hypothetical protein